MVNMFFPLFCLVVFGCSLASAGFNFDVSTVALLYSDTAKGSSYHIYGKANYFMALQVCENNGLRLVRINDQHKSDEITYFVDKLNAVTGPFWTLASRLYDDTTWAFAVGDPVKFFNWSAGEPNNAKGDERCVEMYRNGKWNDERCTEERYVLCESKN